MSIDSGGGTPIINRLRGIVPTAVGWTVAPTNLARCTDDDWAIPTGTGTSTPGAYNYGTYLQFDMGAIYNVNVRAKCLIGNTFAAGAMVHLALEGAEVATFYDYSSVNQASTFNSEYIFNNTEILFSNGYVRGRYIRLILWTETAAVTVQGAVYEIQAIDLGL